MKVFIVFAAVVLAVTALPTLDQEHWTFFKAKHGKSYENIAEEKARFQIFQNNVQNIKAHNARHAAGLETYTMAVNQFADLTPTEFGAMLKRQSQTAPISEEYLTRHVPTIGAPDNVDWRDSVVTEVKDQGNCRSSWAFSLTGAIEGAHAIKNKDVISLSEQQLIDCDTNYNQGCNGGAIIPAFDYLIKNGLNSAEEYPYEGKDGECRAKPHSVVTVLAAATVDANESALKEAVNGVGPISVTMYAEPFQFYDGGIFESVNCTNDESLLDHALLAVGYGVEEGKKYWIIKNSWSDKWGEQGYLRIARDADQCGIALAAKYPIVE